MQVAPETPQGATCPSLTTPLTCPRPNTHVSPLPTLPTSAPPPLEPIETLSHRLGIFLYCQFTQNNRDALNRNFGLARPADTPQPTPRTLRPNPVRRPASRTHPAVETPQGATSSRPSTSKVAFTFPPSSPVSPQFPHLFLSVVLSRDTFPMHENTDCSCVGLVVTVVRRESMSWRFESQWFLLVPYSKLRLPSSQS